MGQQKGKSNRDALLRGLGRIVHSPTHLRVLVAVVMAAIWYFCVYQSLSKSIATARAEVRDEEKKLGLADEIELLRGEVDRLNKHMPQTADPNEAYQYLVEGFGTVPVTVISLSRGTPTSCGPFLVMGYSLEVRGNYAGLDQLLRWIENNPRIMRVDSIDIKMEGKEDQQQRAKGDEGEGVEYSMSLNVLEILGLA